MEVTKFTLSREIREMTVTFDFNDAAVTADLFRLPDGARIIEWILNVKTAFGAGTLTITAGSETLVNVFTLPLVIGTVMITGTGHPALPGYEATAPAITIAGAVDVNTTLGEMDVTCIFSLKTGTKVN